MKNQPSEIKKLLNNLSYCNDYIKCHKNDSYKNIISNTKFYDLKNCVLEFLLRHSKELGIVVEDCELQQQNGKTLILIPIVFDDDIYKFHQIYDDIRTVLTKTNVFVWDKRVEYIRPIKQIAEDIDKFEKCITDIKQYMWNHYKHTLGGSGLYRAQPMKFMKMVELCNKNLKFDIFINGALMKYHITARLTYKGKVIAQKPLELIKKKMLEYIAINGR